ncbi:hypothetical protein BMH30_07790 [Leucobacter sp. OLES1]|nr:hypothetical protein BMH30_07790 [Leucobacter sp. OLES1]
MSEAELVVRAKQGDAASAAQILGAHLPYWMGAARKIISTDTRSARVGEVISDPADLVQQAAVSLLEAWGDGRGPDRNVRSYVSAIMRNSYANSLRSPRAREQLLDEDQVDSRFLVEDDLRLIDIAAETDAVRRAFSKLNQDYQKVLQRVVVEGRKPAQLVEELERPAPAISNLLARAKAALSRQLLVEYLTSGGEECEQNANALPARVHEQVGAHSRTDRGLAHVFDCERCQRNWKRFAAISGTLGVTPLLLVTGLMDGGEPAYAAADGSQPEHANAARPMGATEGSESPNLRAGSSRRMRATPNSGRVAATLASRSVFAVGAVLLGAAVVAGLGYVGRVASHQGERVVYEGSLADENSSDASFEVHLGLNDRGALRTIRADFEAKDIEDWQLEEITLSLDRGTELREASNGLVCEESASEVVCRPSATTVLGEGFVFTVNDRRPGGTFTLDLRARTSTERSSGKAEARW